MVFVELLSDELSADETLVDTIKLEQVIVTATLHDLAMLHDDDLVGVTDGAQSVSDDDDRLLATLDEQVEGLLHLVLTLSVQSRGSLVQQKKLGLANQSTSDSNTLLLTTRELDATLTDHRVISEWEQVLIVDEVVGIRLARRVVKHSLNLILVFFFKVDTIGDVFPDGA